MISQVERWFAELQRRYSTAACSAPSMSSPPPCRTRDTHSLTPGATPPPPTRHLLERVRAACLRTGRRVAARRLSQCDRPERVIAGRSAATERSTARKKAGRGSHRNHYSRIGRPGALDPTDHRSVAQPDRGHLRRDHRPDGTGPARRAHILEGGANMETFAVTVFPVASRTSGGRGSTASPVATGPMPTAR